MSSVLYPGSFDPVTYGHIDVISRLRKIFGHVIVVVADSPRKTYLFSSEERVKLILGALDNQTQIEVLASDDLTVNVAQKRGISVIARSARSVADWEYEYAMADANKKLAPKIETLFVMADVQYSSISSSLVREIAVYNGDTSPFVPPNVVEALKNRGKK